MITAPVRLMQAANPRLLCLELQVCEGFQPDQAVHCNAWDVSKRNSNATLHWFDHNGAVHDLIVDLWELQILELFSSERQLQYFSKEVLQTSVDGHSQSWRELPMMNPTDQTQSADQTYSAES